MWRDVDRFTTPTGDEFILRQRDDIFEIRCNGWDLMSNRSHFSEETLARLVLAEVRAPAPRILIGGLGMGFTLRAALDAAPSEAQVVVAELSAHIIAWNRGPLASLAGEPLEDVRVNIHVCDVAELMAGAPGRFDAIILDIDNGPEAVMYARNAALYPREGLMTIETAMAAQGVLGVWSADRSPAFEAALEAAGFLWRSVEAPARNLPGDPLHTLYLAHARA
jgi:spermidine synthase